MHFWTLLVIFSTSLLSFSVSSTHDGMQFGLWPLDVHYCIMGYCESIILVIIIFRSDKMGNSLYGGLYRIKKISSLFVWSCWEEWRHQRVLHSCCTTCNWGGGGDSTLNTEAKRRVVGLTPHHCCQYLWEALWVATLEGSSTSWEQVGLLLQKLYPAGTRLNPWGLVYLKSGSSW